MSQDRLSASSTPAGWMANPVVRGMVMFSLFRAVYGMGILIVTYVLASGDGMPSWAPWAFLLASMIVSRRLFAWMKHRWPKAFNPTGSD